MSVLRMSVAAVLALSASLACAQGSTLTVEQRLQQLEAEQAAYVYNDAHFHLTNYVQEGTDIRHLPIFCRLIPHGNHYKIYDITSLHLSRSGKRL